MGTDEIQLRATVRQIGRALARLVAGLPGELQDLSQHFANCPVVSRREQRHLKMLDDVQAAMPTWEPLVRHGLSPLGVFYATEAPVESAERLMERGYIPSSRDFLLTAQPSEDFLLTSQSDLQLCPVLPSEVVVREILQGARCGEECARALLSWLIGVSTIRPFLFGKGKAASLGQGKVKITIEPEDFDLDSRWCGQMCPRD